MVVFFFTLMNDRKYMVSDHSKSSEAFALYTCPIWKSQSMEKYIKLYQSSNISDHCLDYISLPWNTHGFVALAWMPPPASSVQYLSCMVRTYHRLVAPSYSSWNFSWSEISSWLAVTSTPEIITKHQFSTHNFYFLFYSTILPFPALARRHQELSLQGENRGIQCITDEKPLSHYGRIISNTLNALTFT